MRNIWWLYVAVVTLTIACSNKGNAASQVNGVNGGITQEKDLTMADYANIEVGPFESFVDIEKQFKQICAQRGEQGQVWFFADSVEIAVVSRRATNYGQHFHLILFSGPGKYDADLVPLGTDGQGNYVLKENVLDHKYIMAKDEQSLNIRGLKAFPRVSADKCNAVMRYALRKSKYMWDKYWMFSELVDKINYKIGMNGADLDANMKVWGNEEIVFTLIELPLARKFVFANYGGWVLEAADATPKGRGSDGGTSYMLTYEGKQGEMKVSADGKTLSFAGKSFNRLTIKTATRFITERRDYQDKHTTPAQFDNLFLIQLKRATSKWEIINNINVKEPYKLPVRTDFRDALKKMEQIRQRAKKIGHEIPRQPIEGKSPSEDGGMLEYQAERDGIKYGTRGNTVIDEAIDGFVNPQNR